MNAPLPLTAWVRATPRHVAVDNAGEVIILDPGSNRYFSLDGVGGVVWKLLQAPAQVAELRDAVVERYDVTPDVALGDLRSLLADLIAAGLVDLVEEPTR
jgi:hypothetical protein